MSKRSGEDTGALLVHAGTALGLLQGGLGELLGVSTRTIRRWMSGSAYLTPRGVGILAGAVYAKNPSLAARIAAAHGATLEELGIVVPQVAVLAPASASPRDLSAERLLVDTIVCSAAEVADVSPRVMRAALAAALERAREVGLALDGAQALFAPPAPTKKK